MNWKDIPWPDAPPVIRRKTAFVKTETTSVVKPAPQADSHKAAHDAYRSLPAIKNKITARPTGLRTALTCTYVSRKHISKIQSPLDKL